jgi:hypothetical protein
VVIDIGAGHCRRRKIRCLLPSPDDTQGRCTNCIRLKKECNFYPVDQGPPIDIKPTAQTRGDITMSSAPSASSHSSPHMSGASQPSSVAESAAHLHYHSPEAGTKRQKRDMGAFAVPASAQGLHNLLYLIKCALTLDRSYAERSFLIRSSKRWAVG